MKHYKFSMEEVKKPFCCFVTVFHDLSLLFIDSGRFFRITENLYTRQCMDAWWQFSVLFSANSQIRAGRDSLRLSFLETERRSV